MKIKILLILCLLFVAACAQEEGAQVQRTNPFRGGTEGVSINYVENSPPSEVFDGGGSPFNIVVKVKNIGEYFVPKNKAFVELSGFAPEAFGLTAGQLKINPPEDLIAATIDSQGTEIPGNEVYAEFQNLNHQQAITGASFTYPTIRAEVCYQYGTIAQSVLCSRENLV